MKEKGVNLSKAIESSRKAGRRGHGKSHEKIEAIYHRAIANLDSERREVAEAIDKMRADAEAKGKPAGLAMSLSSLGTPGRYGN